jgi:RNA polymerase sigma factor (sigma-70 family)
MSTGESKKDIVLIRDILEGNRESYQILYDRYKKTITDFIKKKYSIYYDIEDDVSEILIKVFMNIHTYDSKKSKFKSWVLSIAKNHMIDRWRSGTITITNGDESFTINSCNTVSFDCNYSCDMGSMSFDTTNLEAINSTFTTSNCCGEIEFENTSAVSYIADQISAVDFTLLDMKYVQGYNYDEIGSEFNLTSSTISNRVNYIKTKLKNGNLEDIYD